MKITHKISILTVFLIAGLAVNTFVGMRQLANVHREFAAVANQDVALMEELSAVNEDQLEKNILLEKLIAIAEELGFGQPSFARAQYLNDQLKILQEGFDRYASLGEQAIQRAKHITVNAIGASNAVNGGGNWPYVLHSLEHVEASHVSYDQLISQMLHSVQAGGFQLSIDDLRKFKSQEDALSQDLKTLLTQVRGLMHTSLGKTKQWQDKAQSILFLSLDVIALLSLLLAFWIIVRISLSLKDLTAAAQQVGKGNFAVNLPVTTHDEIAEVTQAFNTMSARLDEFTQKLEEQNKVLANNLDLTKQQKEDLVKVNQELDQYIHTLSHDIVEPLTGIVGYGAYLESHNINQLDQKGQDCVKGVCKNAGRLTRLIKDLLESTRLKRIKSK